MQNVGGTIAVVVVVVEVVPPLLPVKPRSILSNGWPQDWLAGQAASVPDLSDGAD